MAARLVYHTGRSTLRFLGLCLKRQIPSGTSARGLTQSNNQHNIGAFHGIIWFLIVRASAAIDAAQKCESKQTERFQASGFEAAGHSINDKERQTYA